MIGEFNKDQNALPFTAASIIVPYMTVVSDTGKSKRQVVPAVATGSEPVGINGAATAAQGDAVTIYGRGAVVEGISTASIGAGADVSLASTGNGGLGLTGEAAEGVVKYRTGYSIEPAAAGEKFSLYVAPRLVGEFK